MKWDFEQIRDRASQAVDKLADNMPAAKAAAAITLRRAEDAVTKAGKGLIDSAEKAHHCFQDVRDDENVKRHIDNAASALETTSATINRITTKGATALTQYLDKKRGNKGGDEGDIQRVIEKLKSRDKVGVSGEVITTAGGVAAGVAASGAIASAAGASTLLGSSTLASIFGGVFVTTTPVGWVIGSAVVTGSVAYGLTQLIRSGAFQDKVRQEIVVSLQERLKGTQETQQAGALVEELNQLMTVCVAAELITESDATRMVELIEGELLAPSLALQRLKQLALASGVIEMASAEIKPA